jgi:hypothetical protein
MGRVASQSNTRRWEGSLCVSEEDMPLLFILSHLSSARRRMSQNMDKIADTFLLFFVAHRVESRNGWFRNSTSREHGERHFLTVKSDRESSSSLLASSLCPAARKKRA